MNISEKNYYKARGSLENMGWIHYSESENTIFVNYNKIYADYKNYLNKGGRNDSPSDEGAESAANLTELQELTSNNDEGSRKVSPADCHKDRHNNISNIINNNTSNKINGGVCAPIGAPPQDFIEMAKEYRDKRDKWTEYGKLLENWVNEEVSKCGFPIGSVDYQNRKNSLVDMANRCLHIMYGELNDY